MTGPLDALRRGRAAAADWLVAGADMARAVWRRVRPGIPFAGEADPDCADIPLLVLPGILEPWTYLAPLGRHMEMRGHPVHHVETLGWNIGSIERSVERCLEVLEDRRLSGAIIVAHSKGGLIGKAVMARAEGEVRGMVTLATPFSGSTLGGRLQRLPGLGRSPLGMFLPGSAEITGLAADREVNARIVSLSPAWDQVIPGGSHLEGATNVQLEIAGHFRPARDPEVHALIHDHVHGLAAGS